MCALRRGRRVATLRWLLALATRPLRSAQCASTGSWTTCSPRLRPLALVLARRAHPTCRPGTSQRGGRCCCARHGHCPVPALQWPSHTGRCCCAVLRLVGSAQRRWRPRQRRPRRRRWLLATRSSAGTRCDGEWRLRALCCLWPARRPSSRRCRTQRASWDVRRRTYCPRCTLVGLGWRRRTRPRRMLRGRSGALCRPARFLFPPVQTPAWWLARPLCCPCPQTWSWGRCRWWRSCTALPASARE
mmetsp:Transcript_2093/g.6221  ORF Transcript_2093/g.6221 Transcript_2093/m.6221 type:complete len:245 (+) Transcript_2093:457-1191(+)